MTAVKLVEVQNELQIQHTYLNGESPAALMVESTGGGVGWLDYDQDGWWDLFLNQGGPLGEGEPERPSDAIYRNTSANENRTFVDVSSPARIQESAFGQGLAIADYDGDGFDDVYVTNVHENALWINCGDGTFVESAGVAGIADPKWSASAAWGDLDADGDLDLYVCNYCIYDPDSPKLCTDHTGRAAVCYPRELKPWPDACYFNDGQGGFTEESKQRSLVGPENRALGVAIADFNNDSLMDVYVANDTTENFLFVNEGAGNFMEQARDLGCAVNRRGETQASMGLAVADYDHNGLLDIYSTHYFQESNTLYANFGDQGFQDVTALAGLHRPTLPLLGFGAAFVDLTNSGSFELFVVNGHVDNALQTADPKMPPQLFESTGSRFREISQQAGEYFQKKFKGRGVAVCDFDNDRDFDIAVSHQNEPMAVLENRSDAGRAVALQLVGTKSNRNAIGAKIAYDVDGQQHTHWLIGGASYAAAQQRLFLVPLPQDADSVPVTITWPSGLNQKVDLTEASSLVVEPNET